MKTLYRSDPKLARVVKVEGDEWPGRDSDGESIFCNTHFATEAEAWNALVAECQAGASISANGVRDAAERLDVAYSKLKTWQTRERAAKDGASAFAAKGGAN